ncbi:epididymal secretory glutathione peroxidase isoform X2 [Microtus oregoni]|uniref:epididymal secretory glutathione peroxidase isoform X2 n=1 Tax=Microtus oregoni TaxID=111838 RepID=UPI001BB1725F|nr:epididymal secretory glutathione peroxidase isoform X2 [Microtus oregoni]
MTMHLRVFCLVPLLLASYVQTFSKPEKMKMNCYKDVKGTIYDYETLSLNGKDRVQFKQYAGKHVLFVNVATYCGLTIQYPGMFVQEEDIYLISSCLRKAM